MTINCLKDSFQYAMHGNGAYKGLRQTNTLEAMEYWYHKGVKVFEIDIAKTDDANYVAVAHDLKDKSLRRLELFNVPVKRTSKWFMSQKLFSISTAGLTPLSLRSIIEYMIAHPDIIVMFDLYGLFTKEETRSFVSCLAVLLPDINFWSRFVVEAYNLNMVEGAYQGNSLVNVIYCVRFEKNINEKFTITPEELLFRGIKFISYPWYCTEKHAGEIEEYSKAGITVFSRTRFNTKDEMLKKAGVSVNIIANRFDGIRILYQLPFYLSTYLKRVFVKLYVALRF